MAERVMLARDEEGAWYLRRVASVAQRASGERVYYCDDPIGVRTFSVARALRMLRDWDAEHGGPPAPSQAPSTDRIKLMEFAERIALHVSTEQVGAALLERDPTDDEYKRVLRGVSELMLLWLEEIAAAMEAEKRRGAER